MENILNNPFIIPLGSILDGHLYRGHRLHEKNERA